LVRAGADQCLSDFSARQTSGKTFPLTKSEKIEAAKGVSAKPPTSPAKALAKAGVLHRQNQQRSSWCRPDYHFADV